jgi:hypothetical protein
MMKRRKFIFAGAGAAAIAALGFGGWEVAETQIASGVRRRLAFLRLDEAGLHRFARDQVAALAAKRPSWYRIKVHVHDVFAKGPVVANFGMSNDKRTRKEHTADNLATLFLLSSDFFWNGADTSRTVQYVGLYDPMRPCGNPFARLAAAPDTGKSGVSG